MAPSKTRPVDDKKRGDVADVETFREAVALFGAVGMPARNLAAETRRAYRRDLGRLAKFLDARKVRRLADVTLRDLEAHLAKLDTESYSPATRRRQTRTVKSFFRFLHDHGVVTDNVALRLVAPRAGKREPRYLSEPEYKRLQLACRHHPRDAAIVELFLQTGMRLSELAGLTLDDIELPPRIAPETDNFGFVTVSRNGGNRDTIPLNYKVCRAPKTWLQARPAVEHEALFVTTFRTPMKPRAIRGLRSNRAEFTVPGGTAETSARNVPRQRTVVS